MTESHHPSLSASTLSADIVSRRSDVILLVDNDAPCCADADTRPTMSAGPHQPKVRHGLSADKSWLVSAVGHPCRPTMSVDNDGLCGAGLKLSPC